MHSCYQGSYGNLSSRFTDNVPEFSDISRMCSSLHSLRRKKVRHTITSSGWYSLTIWTYVALLSKEALFTHASSSHLLAVVPYWSMPIAPTGWGQSIQWRLSDAKVSNSILYEEKMKSKQLQWVWNGHLIVNFISILCILYLVMCGRNISVFVEA